MLNKTKHTTHNNQHFLPVFFDLKNSSDQQELQDLIDKNHHLLICDEIESQVKELIKIRHPKSPLSSSEYDDLIAEYFTSDTKDSYGKWVYYSWSNKLVHILGEEEFIELRTSRNLYKITPDERNTLRSKSIGVIGLSVGQMIALTIAMERVAGEIRMADFDLLELSNMNRIRTVVSNIGLSKTIIAAREIAEMDPYIKVKIFSEGITDENIDDFLIGDRKIDLLVEECDGLDIKILSRIKAREYKIPVVMDTNDRGMLDIERFDLNDNMPLLHGLIPEGMTDLKSLRNLSNQEKVPLLGAMVGIDKISSRMKMSLSEMGKSISTWPQLASSVVLGGAMVTDVARRILLGDLQSSGRYYIDFEELIK